jgi:FlaA1/EpsC-like NDP-sugar epimerase
LSFSLAHLLRFDGLGSQQMQGVFFRLLPFVLLIRLPVFFYFNFYHLMVVHFSLHDIREIFKGVALGSVFLVSFTYLSGLMYLALQGYGRGVFVIDLWILAALLIAYRILWKRIIRGRQIDRRNGQGVRRVVLYGAGDAGDLCRRYLERQRERDYEVIGFIDDDLTKMGKRLGGVKVLGDRHHLPVLKDLYQIEEIYVAIHSLSQADLGLIFDACRELALPTYQFQFFTSEYCELPASAYEIAPSPSPSETYKRAS